MSCLLNVSCLSVEYPNTSISTLSHINKCFVQSTSFDANLHVWVCQKGGLYEVRRSEGSTSAHSSFLAFLSCWGRIQEGCQLVTEATDTHTHTHRAKRHAGGKVSTKSVDMPQVRNNALILTTKAPQRFLNFTFRLHGEKTCLLLSFVHCEIINPHTDRAWKTLPQRGAMGAEHVVTGRFPAEDAPAQPGGKTFSRIGLVQLLVFSPTDTGAIPYSCPTDPTDSVQQPKATSFTERLYSCQLPLPERTHL